MKYTAAGVPLPETDDEAISVIRATIAALHGEGEAQSLYGDSAEGIFRCRRGRGETRLAALGLVLQHMAKSAAGAEQPN